MAGAANIRAGGAFVELFTKQGALVSGLRSAQAKLRAFSLSISSMGQRLVGLGVMLSAPLTIAGRMFAEMGSDMLDMSQRTGLTVEALSELKFAAEQSGATVQDLELGMRQMSRVFAGADGEIRGAQGALDRLGLSAEQLADKSQDQRFEMIADAIARIPDPAIRAARATEIFGRGGARLLPLMNEGAAGVQRLREEARRLGITMSEQDAVAAEAFGDTLSAMSTVMKRAAFNVGSALAPSMKELATIITDAAAAAARWIKENAVIVRIVDKAIVALIALGVGFMILGPAIRAISIGVGVLGFAFTALGIKFIIVKGLALLMWAAVSGPIGLIVSGLVLVTGGFLALRMQGSTSLGALGTMFGDLRDTAIAAWGGISDFIAAGDWAGAARVAWLGLQLAFRQTVAVLRPIWDSFIGFFTDAWSTATTFIATTFHNITRLFRISMQDLRAFRAEVSGSNAAAVAAMAPLERERSEVGARIHARRTALAQREGITYQQAIERLQNNAAELMDVQRFEDLGAQMARLAGQVQGPTPGGAADEVTPAQLLREQRAQRERERAAAAANDQAEIRRLQEEMNQSLVEAQWTRALTEGVNRASPGAPRPETDLAAANRRIEARGTFSSFAISGLGASSVTDRIARATEETASNTRRNNQPVVT